MFQQTYIDDESVHDKLCLSLSHWSVQISVAIEESQVAIAAIWSNSESECATILTNILIFPLWCRTPQAIGLRFETFVVTCKARWEDKLRNETEEADKYMIPRLALSVTFMTIYMCLRQTCDLRCNIAFYAQELSTQVGHYQNKVSYAVKSRLDRLSWLQFMNCLCDFWLELDCMTVDRQLVLLLSRGPATLYYLSHFWDLHKKCDLSRIMKVLCLAMAVSLNLRHHMQSASRDFNMHHYRNTLLLTAASETSISGKYWLSLSSFRQRKFQTPCTIQTFIEGGMWLETRYSWMKQIKDASRPSLQCSAHEWYSVTRGAQMTRIRILRTLAEAWSKRWRYSCRGQGTDDD